MNKISKLISLLCHPRQLFYFIINRYPGIIQNDERFIKMIWRQKMGYELDLENPKTYNEKLQWLKLNYRVPEYTTLVDKYLVKDYVGNLIGHEYIIPTLGVWDNVETIDFDSLPDQFVLKCTHDSGGIVICKDKSRLDREAAKRRLAHVLKRNFYMHGREWPYKNVQPRIIAETYMHDTKTDDLPDYKFFCFDGEVKAMFIATERNRANVEVKFDFFDTEFNHLPFTQGHPNSAQTIEKNSCFEEMKVLAAKLSKGMPHVRVDFYEIDGKIYFGEMTFYHHGGWTRFDPHQWDYTFGEWIKLPNANI